MHSCIYEGLVRHRRFAPAEHAFSNKLFMMYLDLDELPHLFARYWLWSPDRFNIAHFRRQDHIGDPRQPLQESARDLVEAHSGHRPTGPVRLLTHLRYFGYRFNPVSFYYCYGGDGETLEAIIAEITNTPWCEQHAYVLDEGLNSGGQEKKRYQFDKAFHVSPFMGMNQHYTWHFNAPAASIGIHMDNCENGASLFDATMNLKRCDITSRSLARVLAQYPLITVQVVVAIYWQALRLWLKRTPFHSHPASLENAK